MTELKKICVLLVLALMLSCLPVFAASTVVTQTFESVFSTEQGKNGFRFVQFDGTKATDLTYQASDNTWRANPVGVIKAHLLTPGPVTDIGYLFTAPQKGVVVLEGQIGWGMNTNDGGDGVLLSVGKGEETLWSQDTPFGETASYSLEVSVRKGDELWFRVNAKRSNGYDVPVWWPTVAYTAKAFQGAAGREGYSYLERRDGELKELTYSEETDRFMASDGVAFMSDFEMMPTDTCSMVTRYTVTESGKHRVTASLGGTDRRSSGNIIYVYLNDKVMWQQIVPGTEKGAVDVRFTAEKDDVIDVEVKTNEFTGFNYGDWSVDVKRFDGSQPFSDATGVLGASYSVDDEFSLSSKIGSTETDDVSLYAIYNDTKFPMTYASGAWSAAMKLGSACKITSTAVSPGSVMGDPAIDVVLDKGGTIKLEGNLPQNKGTNGLLVKVLLNGKEIWSNRVGGDNSIKYTDEVDTIYFVDDMNVTADVKKGDKLTFTFGRWRAFTSGTSMNISDINIKYISGDLLSETTKWKIKQSTVVDTAAGMAYLDGKSAKVDVLVKDGRTLIGEASASALGLDGASETVTVGGAKYVPLRAAAEAAGKTVVWGAERFAVIHDGISTFFGTGEFSEMLSAVKGGSLID